jgi:glucose-6-phosphate isomerase
MLAGAHAMDNHFRASPFADNLPVLLGLIGLWYIDFWGAQSHAILPYYQPLSRFVAHIQQLDMESNGKRVTLDGSAVDYATAPVVWGEPGTNAQHAFMQRLHQGPGFVPIDFIVSAVADHAHDESQRALVANCFAQAQALMVGRTRAEAAAEAQAAGKSIAEAERLGIHREMPGNRPSNTLLVRRFDPFTLGLLTALYEHKVFVQGAVWGINSFDQWGVELGKQLATQLDRALTGDRNEGLDASTAALIAHWRRLQAG